MKFFADNKLIKRMNSAEKEKNSFLAACSNANLLTDNHPIHITLGWSSLLEYLNLDNLLDSFPTFDHQNELFALIIYLLPLESERELLIRSYDQVFVECLTYIKALPQIDPTFLLNQIQQKQKSLSQADILFIQSFAQYEKRLLEHPAHFMHDLILFLAWDRVCVNLAIIFEHVSHIDVLKGLDILKECLLESFQHITAHGRTTPGFFRLVEALYAYEMREENLQIHTEDEWTILCQSASALKSRNILGDVWYIDAAIVDDEKLKKMQQQKTAIRVFTLDFADKLKACLSLVDYMINKLKGKTLEWRYSLAPVEVICLKEINGKMIVDSIIHNSSYKRMIED